MGFVRSLHGVKLSCTLPNRFEKGGVLVCYGRNSIELNEPDVDEYYDLTFVWSVVAVFDEQEYVTRFINKLMEEYEGNVSRYLSNTIATLEDIARMLFDIETGKGMVIIEAPDPIVYGILVGDHYAAEEARRYTVVFVSERWLSQDGFSEWCKTYFEPCRRIVERLSVDEAKDEVSLRDELEECIWDECLRSAPKEIVYPDVEEIYVSIRGFVVQGCKAYYMVRHLLPDWEYAQLERRCG